MSACEDHAPLLHGLLDGELDAANVVRAEAHLRECPHCAVQFEEFARLRTAIRGADLKTAAPERFKARVRDALDREASGARWRIWAAQRGWRWPAAAAIAAMLLVLVMPLRGEPDLRDQIVAGHVRSLMADHLTDVATSDQHAVKPWFAGRIDFSPPVHDLAEAGFPLVGGRVDYIDDHTAAVVVYRRRDHAINLFIWPSRPGEQAGEPVVSARDGYNVRRWAMNGMSCWAISDLNADELAQFERLIKAQAAL